MEKSRRTAPTFFFFFLLLSIARQLSEEKVSEITIEFSWTMTFCNGSNQKDEKELSREVLDRTGEAPLVL